MTGQLWGYLTSVLRLDLAASTGGAVAMIRESDDIWTAYLPSENKAYHDSQTQKGLAFFHIPVPFDVKQIANLIAGNFGHVLQDRYSNISVNSAGQMRYEFSRGNVAFVEMPLSQDTLIIKGRPGWTLTCEKPYQSTAFPDRLLFEKYVFSSVSGDKAILRIKSLEHGKDWDIADLDLLLPNDVQWSRIINPQ